MLVRQQKSFSVVWFSAAIASILGCAITHQALAQPTYSVDAQSSSVPGLNDSAAILTPLGPGTFPPPAVVVPSSFLGITPVATGVGELDALSYGTEPQLSNAPGVQHSWTLSVDEFAVGRPGVPGPSVRTEGAFGNQQAAGDIYLSTNAPGPFLPFPGFHTGLFDGDGGFTLPFPSQGLNLREPANPTPNQIDAGDNLDAWDLDQPVPSPVFGTVFNTPIYFSLDSVYADPLEVPLPFNSGTAAANGFVGGDVLKSVFAGGAPTLYASANQLGLDQLGPDHDDLDALVLWENGDGIYQPTSGPYSWAGGNTDMLLFSVRRGSAVIGQPDSLLGLPIEEGDILVPMGNPGQLPGIFVPAEALGLATVRTNSTAGTFQGFGDDLDALDVQQVIPEPSAGLLALACLSGLAARRRFQCV